MNFKRISVGDGRNIRYAGCR